MEKLLDLGALKRRVRLRGEVEIVTAARVGAPVSLDSLGADLPVVRDAVGLPYLPGSSLKGVLRSTVEALLRGFRDGSRVRPWSCDPLESPCLEHHAQDRDAPERPIDDILAGSCDVCLLFGSPFLAGRISVADLPFVGETRRPPVEVRDHVAIDRDTETASRGKKYDEEVVTAGTRFSLDIVLDNPTNAQIGLLQAGLEAMSEHGIGIGGGRSRGLGRVQIRIEDVADVDARTLLGLAPAPAPPTWDALRATGRAALIALVEGRE